MVRRRQLLIDLGRGCARLGLWCAELGSSAQRFGPVLTNLGLVSLALAVMTLVFQVAELKRRIEACEEANAQDGSMHDVGQLE